MKKVTIKSYIFMKQQNNYGFFSFCRRKIKVANNCSHSKLLVAWNLGFWWKSLMEKVKLVFLHEKWELIRDITVIDMKKSTEPRGALQKYTRHSNDNQLFSYWPRNGSILNRLKAGHAWTVTSSLDYIKVLPIDPSLYAKGEQKWTIEEIWWRHCYYYILLLLLLRPIWYSVLPVITTCDKNHVKGSFIYHQ